MGHVGPLGKTLFSLSPLRSLKFLYFLSFLFILKLSYSKPFHNSLNYASTANIEEVMKFHNLSDKTFETDFNLSCFSEYKQSRSLNAESFIKVNFCRSLSSKFLFFFSRIWPIARTLDYNTFHGPVG